MLAYALTYVQGLSGTHTHTHTHTLTSLAPYTPSFCVLNKSDQWSHLSLISLAGRLHDSLQMERQRLLLPPVPPPMVQGHGR